MLQRISTINLTMKFSQSKKMFDIHIFHKYNAVYINTNTIEAYILWGIEKWNRYFHMESL